MVKFNWQQWKNRAMRALAEIMPQKKESEATYSQAKGCSGTRISRGVVNEEYLNDLRGRVKSYDAFNRMRRSDGGSAALLQVVLLPMLSATYGVKAYSDEPIDQEAAKFIEDGYLRGMSNSWDEHMEEAFTFLPFGASAFEMIEEQRDWLYTDAEGRKTLRKGMKAYKRFAFRCLRTIDRWLFTEDESFNGFHQKATSPSGKSIDVEVTVPHCLVFVNEKEGDNFDGVSIYRPAYKHFTIKDEVYEIEGIGIEKNSIGFPYFQEREEAKGVKPKDVEDAMDDLTKLQAHEEMAMVVRKAWELLELRGEINTEAIHNCIQHHMVMMALSVLADFMMIASTTSTGSFASVDSKKKFFEQSLMKRINSFLRVHNKYSIPRIVDKNYTVEGYPELICHGISDEDITTWIANMKAAVEAMMLTPDDPTEALVREKLELPELDPESAAARKPQQTPALPFGAEPPALNEIFRNNTLYMLSERGLQQSHIEEIRQQKQALREKTAKTLKPQWNAMRESIAKQIEDGVSYEKLAVPEKVRQAYKKILKEAFLEGESMGASAVAKELKKKLGNGWKALAEKKAEIEAEGLSKKDAQDTVYFALHEMARRVGRDKEAA